MGTALVAFAEERIFREHRNVFICVSDFNPGARRLYERLGYRLVGELTDYIVAGHSELLLRKTRGPERVESFVPVHLERSGLLRIDLPLDRAFALLTPEGERLWVEGWEPEYLHPLARPDAPSAGTVFRTRHGGEETLWLVLAFDCRGGRRRLRPPHAGIARRHGERARPGDRRGATEAEITYRMTALSPEGNRKLQEMTPEGFLAMLGRWEVAIRAATAGRPAS